MRTALITILASIALASSACAGGLTERDEVAGGSWSLQFGISQNLTLTSFDHKAISLKYHASPRWAIRAGLDFAHMERDDSIAQTVPDTVLAPVDAEIESSSYRVGLDLLYFPRPKAPVKLYLGGGPFLERRSSQDTNSRFEEDYRRKSDSDAYGVQVTAGVEWFFKDYFSLHAEFGSEIASFTQDNEWTAGDGEERRGSSMKSDGWALSQSAVIFGLSVYL